MKLGLSLGYTNAKNATTIVSGGNTVVANGQQINPYSAPWIVVPTAEYDFHGRRGHKGYLRLDDTFHSKNPGPYNPPTIRQPDVKCLLHPNPSYNQLNVHLGTTWNNWDTSLYALNVLNSHPLLYNNHCNHSLSMEAPLPYRPLTSALLPRIDGETTYSGK